MLNQFCKFFLSFTDLWKMDGYISRWVTLIMSIESWNVRQFHCLVFIIVYLLSYIWVALLWYKGVSQVRMGSFRVILPSFRKEGDFHIKGMFLWFTTALVIEWLGLSLAGEGHVSGQLRIAEGRFIITYCPSKDLFRSLFLTIFKCVVMLLSLQSRIVIKLGNNRLALDLMLLKGHGVLWDVSVSESLF